MSDEEWQDPLAFIPSEEKCSRCKMLNCLQCEHLTPVRDSLVVKKQPNSDKTKLEYSKRQIPPEAPVVSERPKAPKKEPVEEKSQSSQSDMDENNDSDIVESVNDKNTDQQAANNKPQTKCCCIVL